MQRQRDGELVPVAEALAGLNGPVKAIREASPQARHHFTLSDQVNQLVSAREADPDLGFMGRTMALCSLPRTNPGNRTRYVRRNGPYTLVMSTNGLYKLPFGNLPRLILKGKVRLTEGTSVDGEQLRTTYPFINMVYDAYVHGAYETTMELCNPSTGVFAMRGHPEASKRQEFVEAVFLKMHEVVLAVELTAAVTAHAEVREVAREARHAMDVSEPWKRQNVET